jgi:two-component system NarL family sensor kinase
MKPPFKNNILILFFLICLVVIFLARATYKNSLDYKNAAASVQHSQQVLYAAVQLLAINQDVETGVRSFIFTGKNEFLAPFHHAKKVVFRQLTVLKELIKDEPSQLIQADILYQLTRKKIEFSESVIKKRKEAGFEAVKNLAADEGGMLYMDSIRTVISKIQDEENNLLKIRKDLNIQSNIAFTKTFNFELISILLALLLSAVLIFYNSNARKKAETLLIENQYLLQSIINNTSSIIFIKDLNRKFLLVNKSFEKLLGLSKDAIIGKTDLEIFPHHIAAAFNETDKKVLSQTDTLQVEEN